MEVINITVRFLLRQYGKMLLQHVLLPALYRGGCLFHTKVRPELVVFADAHHTALPFSMERMHTTVSARGYQVVCHLHDYSHEGGIRSFLNAASFMLLYSGARYVFICDNFLPAAACKRRKETQLIQLWHSCGLLKRMGYDTTEDVPSFYKGNVHGRYDLVTVSAPCCIPFLTSGMRQKPGIVKAAGVSRTDAYFDEVWLSACREEFFRTVPEAEGKRILLWAPTFRGNAASPRLCGLETLRTLEKRLGKEWKLVIKAHPHLDAESLRRTGRALSNCPIPTERMLPVTDLLITDYSSVLFDYLLLERPFVLFAPDLKEYETGRGFYIDYRSLTLFMTADARELGEIIERAYTAWADGTGREALRQLRIFHCGACDGRATERILRTIGLEGKG